MPCHLLTAYRCGRRMTGEWDYNGDGQPVRILISKGGLLFLLACVTMSSCGGSGYWITAIDRMRI